MSIIKRMAKISLFLLVFQAQFSEAAKKVEFNQYLLNNLDSLSTDDKLVKYTASHSYDSRQRIELTLSNYLEQYAQKTIGKKEITYFKQYYMGELVDGVSVLRIKTEGVHTRWLGSIYLGIESTLDRPPLNNTLSQIDVLDRLYQLKYPQPISQVEIRNLIVESVVKLDEKDKPHYAFKASYYSIENGQVIQRPVVYLSKQSGNIIHHTDLIAYDREPGSGPSGNPKIELSSYEFVTPFAQLTASTAETFFINKKNNLCVMDSDGVQTYNEKDSAQSDKPYEYPCDNVKNSNDKPIFSISSTDYTPINDAHFYGQVVSDMYKGISSSTENILSDETIFNIFENGPFGEEPIRIKVHAGAVDNARWDGTYVSIGDGAGTFYPLTSLDVISHEVAHGVMEKQASHFDYSDLRPSGSIEEAFGDMAGEAVEYFYLGENDWLHNYDSFIDAYGLEAGRYFELPSTDGNSIDSVEHYWIGMQDRYASGIFNKAFYHLVNDNENWNALTAYQLFMWAAISYWSGSVDFQTAAQGVVIAVEEVNTESLSGLTINELQAQVINAFSMVDIYTQSELSDYALFGSQVSFEDLVLTNKSHLISGIDTGAWTIESQALGYSHEVVFEADTAFDEVFVELEDGQYNVTLNLTSVSGIQYSYSKVINIERLYCEPKVGSNTLGYTSLVEVNGERVTDPTEATFYSDFTKAPPFQVTSQSNEITLTPAPSDDSKSWSVWIDNNGDGDFLDHDEWFDSEFPSKEPVTIKFNVTENLYQVKRLRVAQSYSGIPRPRCSFIASGEVEDYSIVFVEEGEPQISASLEQYELKEGESITIEVNQYGNKLNPHSVSIYSDSMVSEDQGDFELSTTQLSFETGEAIQAFTIHALEDSFTEDTEEHYLELVMFEGSEQIDHVGIRVFIKDDSEEEIEEEDNSNSKTGSIFWMLFISLLLFPKRAHKMA